MRPRGQTQTAVAGATAPHASDIAGCRYSGPLALRVSLPSSTFCCGCPFNREKDPSDPGHEPDEPFRHFVQTGSESARDLAGMPALPVVRKGVDVPVGAHQLIAPCWRDLRHDVQSPTDLSTALYINDIRPTCPGVRLLFARADRELFAGLMLQVLETPVPEPLAKPQRRRGATRRKRKGGPVPSPAVGGDLFGAFSASD